MDFTFCAKCDEDFNRLKDRKDKGFGQFEMYTTLESFEKDYDSVASTFEALDMECLVVHAPPTVNVGDKKAECGIASVNEKVNEESIKYIFKSIDLAEKLIKSTNKYVIVHPASDIFLGEGFKSTFKYDISKRYEMIKKARELSIKNCNNNLKILLSYAEEKKVRLCLENMPSLYFSSKGVYESYCSFVNFDDFNRIRSEVDSQNLFFTLDICHLLSYARVLKMIVEIGQPIGCILPEDIDEFGVLLRNEDFEALMIEKYIDVMGEKLGVVHLNGLIEYGMDSSTHSTSFNTDDEFLLKRVMSKLKTLDYKDPITLEINEDDLNNAQGLLNSYNILLNILRKQN